MEQLKDKFISKQKEAKNLVNFVENQHLKKSPKLNIQLILRLVMQSK